MSTALWQLLGGQNPQVVIAKAIEKMRAEGIAKIEADYSGGNDEGGVQQVRAFKADGTEMELPSPWGGDREYDEESLWAMCDDILGSEFGTWAGEFYASGTLYIDPAHDPKCWRKGEYETPSSSEDYNEF